MAIPSFADIAKPSNDLLNKDFYHTAAAILEVKSKAPNGVSFNVKGKSSHDPATTGQIEAKYNDAPTGTFFDYLHFVISSRLKGSGFFHSVVIQPRQSVLLMQYVRAGLTITQAWTTLNALDTKVELDNTFAHGLKAEITTQFLPSSQSKGAKLNLHFKQPNFHARAFFDLLKGPTANVDAVLGHDGFLVGAEAGYDVQKAAITRYSAAIGYSVPAYAAAITATNNLSIFSASYYHKVNSDVEAGAKATWDSKSSNSVGLEVASKYKLDGESFAKAKINDRGIAALAYNVRLRPGVTLGLGASFDTQNLNQSAHKVGASFTFES
ncbi:MAG: Voltage-dependent anion-selective channel protein 1 [Geoglossum simile]|nr:MAG: Voltage-dependent anion-selective channel protein 1 [Geoglossum simile]